MMQDNNFNRRNFLRGLTAGAVGAGAFLNEIRAEAQEANKPDAAAAARTDEQLAGPPVTIAVIGLGSRGREILTSLAKVGPNAQVTMICDKFTAPVFVKKSTEIAPKATFVDDYRKVLDDKSIQAVFIATPTHTHKQIALDAIAAGKHVYLEAPLAHTIEDAKAIAQAGKAAKAVFQSGLQNRCNGQTLHVGRFVHSNAVGKLTEGRAQWHDKTTWRTAWPTPEREAELNWRLKRETSNGLMGEIGMHQLDIATFFIKGLPVSVSGYGGILLHNDGRDVPDTVQCVVEYPKNLRVMYDATLTNSFDGSYELFMGSDAAVILRDQRAWMFKENDAGQLGWEVFARKDEWVMGNPAAGSGMKLGTGIALVADATKQLALGKQPGEVGTDVTKTALYQAAFRFLKSCQKGARDFAKDPTDENPNPPLVPGAEEGYQATVVGIKSNEAVLTNSKIVFQPDWFTL